MRVDMESKRKRSLRSAHKYEKKVKLNNDQPTLFDKIPFEILSIMVQYLTKKSLIAWNGVNKRFYESSVQKLWNQPSSWLSGKVHIYEISHLPIKTLHSKFLINQYDVPDIMTYLPRTLNEYIIDDYIERAEYFLPALNKKVKIIIDAAHLCRSEDQNILEGNYIDIVNDLKIQVELGPIGRRVHFYDEPDVENVDEWDLAALEKSHFRRFYVERVKISRKTSLIRFLCFAKIDEICLNFFQYYTSNCKFNRNDITRMKDCNLKSIATSVLERPNYIVYAENPWIELSQIKSLEQLIINPWTDFSLYRLQSFSFYAITIGQRKKQFVSNIVELRELFECRCVSMCARVQGPMWIYNFGVYIVIHLNNSG